MPGTKTATKAKYTDRTGRANPRVRPKDPETGEVLLGEESSQTPAHTPGPTSKASKEEKALYIQKAEQTVRWNQLKIERAEKELQLKLGNLVDREEFMRQILEANQIVKNLVLGVIEEENLSHEQRLRLRKRMIEALNELAYERGTITPSATDR
jgi:hypothetical protein